MRVTVPPPDMPSRSRQRTAFIDGCGWGHARIEALPGDASFRRYFRLVDADGRRAIVMDAPPPSERVEPFARVAEHLHRLGLSAPRILAIASDPGFLLLEDLGDATFTRLLNQGESEAQLYALAMEALIALQGHPQANSTNLESYDSAQLLQEAALFADWYLPALLQRPTPDAQRTEFLGIWREILSPVLAGPRTLVLRDFHVDNLIRLADRPGPRACGLLDFQDALLGHPAYDLVSLLEDARRDVNPAVAQASLAHYLAAFPTHAGNAFATACAMLAAQRHCKVAGIFVRLWVRDGKPGYLGHLPRVMRLLESRLQRAELAPLRRWMDRHAPQRRQPLGMPDREQVAAFVQSPVNGRG